MLLFPLPARAQEGPNLELMGIQALVFAENAVASLPGEYTFKIHSAPTLPPLKPGKLTFEALRLSKDEPVGRFFIVFRVSVDGRPAATARVEMEGSWSGELYQAKTALQRKAVITEDDLQIISFDGVPPAGALKELPEDIRLRQPMGVGKIITQTDIEPIPLINPTDRVRVTFKNGSLQIIGDATARSGGAKGDRVRLEMDGSKKIVQAVITGAREALIDVDSRR
ncbi:MAG: flagellar basal body P-ring formation chaperone FlgA [Holophagaceae bacterium]|nr:flagellar basal body P-ring formation chaperone FlgA [Holophagaceae bacterium]